MSKVKFEANSLKAIHTTCTDTSEEKIKESKFYRDREDIHTITKKLKSFKIEDIQVLWTFNEFLRTDRLLHPNTESATTIALKAVCKKKKINSSQAVEIYFYMQDIMIELKKHPLIDNYNFPLYDNIILIAIYLMNVFEIEHTHPRLIKYKPYLKNGGKR